MLELEVGSSKMEKLWLFLIPLLHYFMGVCAFSDSDIDKLGNFFRAVEDSLETIKEYIPDEDGHCRFRCDDGSYHRKNPNHEPTSDGCGSFGLQLDTRFLPAMKKCCDEHDLCYDTCFKIKDDCDKVFRTCLLDMCKVLKFVVDEQTVNTGCSMAADVMYRSTALMGCKAYKAAQKKACSCGYKTKTDSSSISKKSKDIPLETTGTIDDSMEHEWEDSKKWMNAVVDNDYNDDSDSSDSDDISTRRKATKNQRGKQNDEL